LQPSEDGQSTRLVIGKDVYDSEGGPRTSPLRVTVAVSRPEERPEIFHQEHPGWGLVGDGDGAEDSVFSEWLTRRYAKRLRAETFRSYEGQGHLLFVTEPRLFDDVRAFFGLGS